MAVLRRFTSAFTLTGGNLGAARSPREAAALFDTAPFGRAK